MCDCGGIECKDSDGTFQCCNHEGFTILKKIIGMFSQPVESENQLQSERQQKIV